jgi:nitroreductase
VSGLTVGGFLKGLARLLAGRPRLPQGLADNAMLRTILERRSIRRFRAHDLPADHWEAILEAGRLAPSTVNLQTWSFAWFTRASWQETFGRPLPFAAPRAVMVLADTHRARRAVAGFPHVPLCDHTVGVMNASLAAMAMTLAAEALGVGSVMLSETGRTGFYDARELGRTLALPPGVVPLMTIVFGWPDQAPVMPPKLPPEAVAFTGAYRETPQAVLDDWYAQMQAGYRAGTGQAFARQIELYNRRLGEAEDDLQHLVLGAAGEGGHRGN